MLNTFHIIEIFYSKLTAISLVCYFSLVRTTDRIKNENMVFNFHVHSSIDGNKILEGGHDMTKIRKINMGKMEAKSCRKMESENFNANK